MDNSKRLVAVVAELFDSDGPCARDGCTAAAWVRFDPPPDAVWERQNFCHDHAAERVYELTEPHRELLMPISMLDRHHFMWAGTILCAVAWDRTFWFYLGNLCWRGPFSSMRTLELEAAATA